MRKLIIMIVVCLAILAGCGTKPAEEATEPAGQMQIGNPWKSYDTLADAQAASGLVFPLPESIPNGYGAEIFRVMNGKLLEVQYKNGESGITVRIQAGENEDISGVYENFTAIETSDRSGAAVTRKQADDCIVYLIFKDGYSYSVCLPGTVSGDLCNEILANIC